MDQTTENNMYDYHHVRNTENGNEIENENPFDLTDECHHYESVGEVPWDIQKYWQQRYSIWSLYDEGVAMTDDAWFGVTPEPVANHVASDLSTWADASKTTVIDIFAGAGGNAIAFALSERWEHVIAVERNASVLACAKNNAAIYGVLDKITWIHDDCFKYISQNRNHSFDTSSTVIFASPPWGGPGYSADGIFDLSTMQPYSVDAIHGLCKGMDCALYLPRTSDLRQLARLTPDGNGNGNEEGKEQSANGKMDVVHYCVEGASKALVAYIPAAAVDRQEEDGQMK